MKVLVINSGSSSIKYQLIDMNEQAVLAEGVAERIGQAGGRLTHCWKDHRQKQHRHMAEGDIGDHAAGLVKVAALLADADIGVLDGPETLGAVGHRIVHGGERFCKAALIDDAVVAAIEQTVALAPLHNPAGLAGIRTARRLFANVPQVAVFDTAFHQSLAPEAYRYALPSACYRQWGIRRFGFHGTSHAYVVQAAADMMARPLSALNLVVLHLGNGSSVSAVQGGRSKSTSMGMTPLEGVIMGSRCGSIDPAIPAVLSERMQIPMAAVMTMLTEASGLKGICGHTDLRDIHELADAGDRRARLALNMLVRSIKQQVGACFAVLDRVDAMIFTAGIGENDPLLRARVCERLDHMGVTFDAARNGQVCGRAGVISSPDSPVAVLVIPTNEALEIARQTAAVVNGSVSSSPLPPV